MNIVLFEDDLVNRLYPITVGRPAFAISCGGHRLIDFALRLGHPIWCLARPHLKSIVQNDYPISSAKDLDQHGPTLLVNARMVPSVAVANRLSEMISIGTPGIVKSDGATAVALLPAESPLRPQQMEVDLVEDYLQGMKLDEIDLTLPLFNYPHDVIGHHLKIFGGNLEYRLCEGSYEEIADGVFCAPGAKLGEYVVTDTSGGPILLERDATVGPYCFLSGPALLGERCRVLEHAAIKDGVSLGHTTKIGGEVEASIIEPYTNKQHHGFLGHSCLGSWINLGAGTCNSDLKNTYGHVKMEYGHTKIDTRMQFVGAIIGDYAKTAINTGIFTGKTIGVGSMVYGFVTTNVPSFVNYARSFGKVSETPPEVLVATQARMFVRRNVTQRPCDVELLHDMYALTVHERRMAGEPLSL